MKKLTVVSVMELPGVRVFKKLTIYSLSCRENRKSVKQIITGEYSKQKLCLIAATNTIQKAQLLH